MEISFTILLGVISGVLTTSLLFLSGRFFSRVILPWYRAIKYQGVDLNGTWEYKDKEVQGATFEMIINQNAHDIAGDALVQKSQEKGASRLTFDITGTVWEGYISLTMKSKDRTRLSFGTMLLKVCNGGQRLDGNFAWRGVDEDLVKSGNVVLTRRR